MQTRQRVNIQSHVSMGRKGAKAEPRARCRLLTNYFVRMAIHQLALITSYH